MTKLKALKHKSVLNFLAYQKKFLKLTDSTHTIHSPTNITKKQQTVKKNLSKFYICQH